MTTTRLDAIRQREQAATEGPWETYLRDHVVQTDNRPPDDDITTFVHHFSADTYGLNRPFDAAFIAHARADIPALLRVAEAAMETRNGIGSLLWVANNLHNHQTDTFREFMESALEDWRKGYDQLAAALAPLLEPEP